MSLKLPSKIKESEEESKDQSLSQMHFSQMAFYLAKSKLGSQMESKQWPVTEYELACEI